MMKNNGKTILFYVVLIIVILFASYFLLGTKEEKPPEYSEIVTMFENGEVEAYNVTAGNVLDIKTRDKTNSSGVTVKGKEFSVKLRSLELFERDIKPIVYALNHDDDPDNDITSYNYEPPKETSLWLSFLPYILMIVFFVVLWFFAMNSAMGGKGGKINSFGKSRARVNLGGKNKVMFTDVAGADEEKEELQEVVDFLRNPGKYSELGARIPKGVLLVGAPGTGKTLLAKAVAGESGVPFYSISGSDFVEMYVGVGASRVRDLFETAKKTAPCIIFIDEIDAVGRHRGAGLGGGHDEREQTLNQLLVEMDGFGVNDGVIVMAATNRPDILDPALLRPGRFDRQITVNYPDIKGREEILKVHARNKPLGKDVDLATVAKTTVGFTGADLANLLNEAALHAARKKKTVINTDDIEEATIKVIVGPQKKSSIILPEEKHKTAVHEAGHAIVQKLVGSPDPVHQISVIPSGRALGYTLSFPEKDKRSVYKNELLDNICMLLGGRAAEQLVNGDISGGASNDMERATEIARNMVTKLGMSDVLGPVVYSSENNEVFLGKDFGTTKNYSEKIAELIDDEIEKIIKGQFERALKILGDNRGIVEFIADYLVKHEIMDGEQFELCFRDGVTEADLDAVSERKANRNSKENEERRAELEKAKSERKRKTPRADDDSGKDDIFSDDVFKE